MSESKGAAPPRWVLELFGRMDRLESLLRFRHENDGAPPRSYEQLAGICISVASQVTGVSEPVIRSRLRSEEAVWARWCAIHSARQVTGCSNRSAVARAFGVDHSAIIHIEKELPIHRSWSAQHGAQADRILARVREIVGAPDLLSPPARATK